MLSESELSTCSASQIVPESFYSQISSILSTARNKAYAAANFAMVEAYWEIGHSIIEQQGNDERAGYGEALLQSLAERLTADFGKGFDVSNLRYMRQFFLAFPIRDALRHELSWMHRRSYIFPSKEELAQELSAEYRALDEFGIGKSQ